MELSLADRVIDLDTGRISTGGSLRAMELRILRHLARRPGSVVSARELLVEVWGYAPDLRTSTVHTTVYRLRSAIEADPRTPRHLITVPGVGVKLADIRPVVRRATNLPRPRDRLVGREDELHRADRGRRSSSSTTR